MLFKIVFYISDKSNKFEKDISIFLIFIFSKATYYYIDRKQLFFYKKDNYKNKKKKLIDNIIFLTKNLNKNLINKQIKNKQKND